MLVLLTSYLSHFLSKQHWLLDQQVARFVVNSLYKEADEYCKYFKFTQYIDTR